MTFLSLLYIDQRLSNNILLYLLDEIEIGYVSCIDIDKLPGIIVEH